MTVFCETSLVVQIMDMQTMQMRNYREVSPKTILKELHISMKVIQGNMVTNYILYQSLQCDVLSVRHIHAAVHKLQGVNAL